MSYINDVAECRVADVVEQSGDLLFQRGFQPAHQQEGANGMLKTSNLRAQSY